MDKIRSLLSSDDGEWTKVVCGGGGGWREVNRFEKYLELKGLGVVAWGWEGKGEIKDATQNSGCMEPHHSLR